MKRLVWRVTYAPRAPGSPRAPVRTSEESSGGSGSSTRTSKVVASDDPLPSPPTLASDGENVMRHWHDWAGGKRFSTAVTSGLDSLYDIEIAAMTSPEMRALGVEVFDASAMMAMRSDAHTQEGQDSNTAVHTCLPGPIDDVNSLIINLACYR